jgi:hypothetical protein
MIVSCGHIYGHRSYPLFEFYRRGTSFQGEATASYLGTKNQRVTKLGGIWALLTLQGVPFRLKNPHLYGFKDVFKAEDYKAMWMGVVVMKPEETM